MANKYIGKATTVDFTYNSTQSTVANVMGATPPACDFGEVESTDLDSLRRAFLPTLLEDGIANFNLAWDPDDVGHVSLFAAFQAGATVGLTFRLATTLLNKRIIKGTGFWKSFHVGEITSDGLLMTTGAFRCNSLTAPASST